MRSISPEITALHAAYCAALGIDLLLTASAERHWYEAQGEGVTAETIRAVLADRQKRIRAGVRHKESLLLRNLIGDEDRIGDLLNEFAVLKAAGRVRVMEPGRAAVLKATGRPAEIATVDARPVADVIEAMRKAAG